MIPLILPLLLAPDPVEPVELPSGTSSLLDIGRYEVTYRIGDGEWVTMPTGWTGHFEPGVGISFAPWISIQGRRTVLLHCPWMNGTGQIRVRYPLRLPNQTPIILSLGYGMDPTRTQESDGVTFGVAVHGQDGASETLLDEHTDAQELTRVEFDLSAYAGQAIDLVLSAGPGPAGNSSWDYSLFAEPEIRVGPGTGAPSEAARLAQVEAIRERWADGRPTLGAVGPGDGHSVVPTVGATYTNSIEKVEDGWLLHYQGSDLSMAYVIDPSGVPEGIYAELPDGDRVDLGGITLRWPDGSVATWELKDMTIEETALTVQGRVLGPGGPISAEITHRVEGKSLLVSVRCTEGGIDRLAGLGPRTAAWRRQVSLPYLTGGQQWYLPDLSVYVGSLLDWTASSASSHSAVEAQYGALSDGSRIPLQETAIVTVSPYLAEILPSVPSAPSPWIEDLSHRVIVDDWMGNFEATRRTIETWQAHGLTDLLVQVHVWQNGGYDAKLPDVLPANESMGGDEGMKALSAAARAAGYRFGLHENYVDIYPDAPSWDESLVARNADGSLVKAWYNEATGIQSYGYRADAIVPTARRFTPQVHERYDTTCSFIDVHCAVPPWFHVDFTAGQPVAGRFLPVWEAHTELWRMFREVHHGPVLGEGNNHWYWSGRMDGAEAQVDGGEHHTPFPEFNLLKVHPLVVNHGMGYIPRWVEQGYGAGGLSRLCLELADKYRTQELLYGHAGFIDSAWIPEPLLSVKEAWMLKPLQERYAPARVVDTEYLVAEEWVDGSTALAVESTRVCRIVYDNGLTLVVNQSDQTIEVDGLSLPPYGFVAKGAGVTEAYIAELDGQVVDFVRDERSIVADARGFAYHAGMGSLPIEPLPPEVRSLGPRQFEITYRWGVTGPLAEDAAGATSFVHFVSPESDHPEGIAFQNDHALPGDVAAWTPGEQRDGPHVVSIPPDLPSGEYEITVGILSGSARQALRGPVLGNNRYLVGTLEVGDDGTVALIRAGAPEDWPDPFARYSARFNTERWAIDFGPLVTSGAVRLVLEDEAVRVYPLPQEVAFDLSVRPADLGLEGTAYTIQGLGADGTVLSTTESTVRGDLLEIPLGGKGVCSYRVTGTG